MKFELEKFAVKDIVFLAVMAALLFICSAVAMPLMTITLFGLRNLATSIFFGVFGTIAIMKVRKPGAMSILGFLNGAILVLMSPVMFVTTTVSAILGELISLAIFKSYDNDKAIMASACLMMPLSLPFTAVFSVIMNGVSFGEVIGFSGFVFLTCLGTVALSFLGGFIGRKIGNELKKAGKLK